jgi:alpha-ketoglutarate-dependent taurine dioxygenase
LTALQAPQFTFRVPREFSKETDHVIGAILMGPSPSTSPREDNAFWKMRYRRDVIDPMNEEAQAALDKLEEVLAELDGRKGSGVNILGPDVMTEDAVVVVDNARFLHARSEINDPRRWLRRVRWAPEVFT